MRRVVEEVVLEFCVAQLRVQREVAGGPVRSLHLCPQRLVDQEEFRPQPQRIRHTEAVAYDVVAPCLSPDHFGAPQARVQVWPRSCDGWE